jgi:hypothetical protein
MFPAASPLTNTVTTTVKAYVVGPRIEAARRIQTI